MRSLYACGRGNAILECAGRATRRRRFSDSIKGLQYQVRGYQNPTPNPMPYMKNAVSTLRSATALQRHRTFALAEVRLVADNLGVDDGSIISSFSIDGHGGFRRGAGTGAERFSAHGAAGVSEVLF